MPPFHGQLVITSEKVTYIAKLHYFSVPDALSRVCVQQNLKNSQDHQIGSIQSIYAYDTCQCWNGVDNFRLKGCWPNFEEG